MWKESQCHCLRLYSQTTRVEPSKTPPRQVVPPTAHTRCLVDTCSPPGERFFYVTFPSPVVAVHFVLIRSFITHFRLFLNAFLRILFWSQILSSTRLVEILGLELHLLSGWVQVRAVQLSSPVLPAVRISSEEMCGKRASAIVFVRIVRQPGLSQSKQNFSRAIPSFPKKNNIRRLAMQLLSLERETFD